MVIALRQQHRARPSSDARSSSSTASSPYARRTRRTIARADAELVGVHRDPGHGTPARPRLRANERPGPEQAEDDDGTVSHGLTVPRVLVDALVRAAAPRPRSGRARGARALERGPQARGSDSSRAAPVASACASPGGATSPRPNSRTVSPGGGPTSLTTTGRPVADRRSEHPGCVRPPVRQDDDRRVRHQPATSSSGTKPSRHSMRASTRAARARAPARARRSRAGRPRRRAARLGQLRERSREHVEALVARRSIRRRAASFRRRRGLPWASASNTGCGIYAMRSRATPSAARSSTRCRKCTTTRRTMSYTCRRASTPRALVARQRMMRGVHRRRAGRDAAQPAHVQARQREPLHVHDVRLELAQAGASGGARSAGTRAPLTTKRARARGLRASSLPLSRRKSSSRR